MLLAVGHPQCPLHSVPEDGAGRPFLALVARLVMRPRLEGIRNPKAARSDPRPAPSWEERMVMLRGEPLWLPVRDGAQSHSVPLAPGDPGWMWLRTGRQPGPG